MSDLAHFSLLPLQRTFRQLLIPFAGPYFLYVAVEAVPIPFLNPMAKQAFKLVLVSLCMLYFRHAYTFGQWKRMDVWLTGLAWSPLALAVWVLPMLWLRSPSASTDVSMPYLILRGINSVVLVALFEELFIRAYLMEWFYLAQNRRSHTGRIDDLFTVFEDRPQTLFALPLNRMSLVLTTLVFTVGHDLSEYLSALFYFSLTNWIYYRTRNFALCILVHALTNLYITILVYWGTMTFLWF